MECPASQSDHTVLVSADFTLKLWVRCCHPSSSHKETHVDLGPGIDQPDFKEVRGGEILRIRQIMIILETIVDEVGGDNSPLPFRLCLCFHLVGRWSPVFQLTHLPWHTGTGVRSAKSKKLMSFVAKLTRKAVPAQYWQADPTFPQSHKCCSLSFLRLWTIHELTLTKMG